MGGCSLHSDQDILQWVQEAVRLRLPSTFSVRYVRPDRGPAQVEIVHPLVRDGSIPLVDAVRTIPLEQMLREYFASGEARAACAWSCPDGEIPKVMDLILFSRVADLPSHWLIYLASTLNKHGALGTCEMNWIIEWADEILQ
jgi:hypothetical protein